MQIQYWLHPVLVTEIPLYILSLSVLDNPFCMWQIVMMINMTLHLSPVEAPTQQL